MARRRKNPAIMGMGLGTMALLGTGVAVAGVVAMRVRGRNNAAKGAGLPPGSLIRKLGPLEVQWYLDWPKERGLPHQSETRAGWLIKGTGEGGSEAFIDGVWTVYLTAPDFKPYELADGQWTAMVQAPDIQALLKKYGHGPKDGANAALPNNMSGSSRGVLNGYGLTYGVF